MSLFQSIYYQNLLFPMLYGIKPIKINIFHPPLPPSPPSTPPTKEYRSFFQDTMNAPYSHLEKAILPSTKLRSQAMIDHYKKKGLQWLRRHETKNFTQILRNPYIGCMVELSSKPSLFTVHIDSKKAKKIIYRDCYF
jgi:hypothetical protein